jgi:hypothetical protein
MQSAAARRRLILGCVVRVTLTTALLLVVYFLIPLDSGREPSAVLYFVVCAALFVGAVAWQIRAILIADYPGLRAVEAVGLALPLFIILFAVAYLWMSVTDAGSFSEPLDRISGLYFTITVLATVGFGDISPRTDAARLTVSLQMLLDLAILGVLARLVVGAARQNRRSRESGRE